MKNPDIHSWSGSSRISMKSSSSPFMDRQRNHGQNGESVCCLLSAVCCLLSAFCCLLSAVCCLLSAGCCLLSAVCCLLSAVCWLMSAVYCQLSDLKLNTYTLILIISNGSRQHKCTPNIVNTVTNFQIQSNHFITIKYEILIYEKNKYIYIASMQFIPFLLR